MDKNIIEFMKLSRFSEIEMTVNGETNKYRFSENPKEDGFELHAIDSGEKNVVYGLSCNSIPEVISALIQDYYNGIITNVVYIRLVSPSKSSPSNKNKLDDSKTCLLNEKEIREKAILDYTKWCYIHGIDFSYMGTQKNGAQFCEDVITRYKEDKNIEQEEYEGDYE